jgi:hypothetical protein
MPANAWISFACLSTFCFVLQSAFYSNYGVRPSHKNSNNPLAGEPETENDAARVFPIANPFMISHLLQRRLQRPQQGFIQMINTLTRATTLGALLITASLMNPAPAFSQAPTQAQRDAIKSECRSDYMAHCSSVPPGGEASLQCLQKNMSSLSSACQGAVRAVEAPAAAAPKTEQAPAAAAKPATETAAPKAASTAAAKQPSSAQVSAIRSACRSDYPKVCAGVPTGGAPALQCLEKNKAKLSPACEKAVAAASGGGAATAAGGTATAAPASAPAAAAPAAPAAIVLRPLRPREELFVLRSACGADVRSICGGVAPGGGRIVQCLATNAASLSPACNDVLGQFAAQ